MGTFCVSQFIFIIFLIVSIAFAQVPSYVKSKYGNQFATYKPPPSGGGVKSSYTKTKTRPVSSYAKTGSYAGGGNYPPNAIPDTQSSKYRGGCFSEPPTPMNAGVRCSLYSGCRANCIPNYQFPNGASETLITCQNGLWIDHITGTTTIPSCEPICLPPCQNNGICLAPGQCNCPESFSGPQCQYENKPCLLYPPAVVNSKRSCRANMCTISCLPGHQFPDGSAIVTMSCKNGMWEPSTTKWPSIPNCEAICNPPCLNGGNCLSFNVCQCPQDYRGPQCQYQAVACSAKNLQFNGAYSCTSDSDTFTCSVACPEGIPFEFPPEPAYTCQFSTGTFQPTPIPQCVFPTNVRVIPQPESSQSFYTMNNSGFNLNSLSVNGLPPTEEHSYQTKSTKYHPDGNKFFNDTNVQIIPLGQYGRNENQFVTVEVKLPKPGSCFTWGGTHIKTFDGKVFSFNSKCSYVLVRDAVDNTFSVVVQNSDDCYINPSNCYKIVKIYLQDKQYFLKRANGIPVFASAKKILPIPGRLAGIRVEMSAHYIVVSLDSVGAKLKWDGQQLVHVEVKESLWNRTEGLCGKIDGDLSNDGNTKDGQSPKSIVTLATSWKIDDLEDICNDTPTEEHACQESGIKETKARQAKKFCQKLLSDKRFAPCHKLTDITSLLDVCKWDYCSCNSPDPSECACETVNVYVRDCSHKGVKGLTNWRDEQTCPLKCDGGKIYKSCGPAKGQPVCGAATELEDDPEENCAEGCFCPDGTVLHENKCITRDQCPCRLRGKNFPPGSSIPKDCNTCTCNDGLWVCTQVSCGARCSAIGDPHYLTFDGKRYDFMGQCSYYLVKTNNFSIEAENVACAGSISQAMNFPSSISSGLPSCTKTVTIRINGQVVKLKQNHDVVINGQDINKVPYAIAGIMIRSVSSIFLLVELPNGIEIWWDGVTRAYIDVPASFKDKTKGLCGTFNNNQKDDFLTPEDDVEQAVIPFANKWKTDEKCNDVPEVLSSHPCDVNIHKKATAEKYCRKIKSNLFKDCHWYVDPEEYYQNCLYDMCACEFKVSKCLCPTISGYASECSRKGVKIDWRNDIRECGLHCPGGQKYQVCGNSCTRTCSDVSTNPECRAQCVEGCNCPEGEALDDNGECIPIGQCKCQQDGLEFPPGYKEVRPGRRGQELCVCVNALWRCGPARPEEIKAYPKASDLKSMCNAEANMEFTTCEPVEPVTCKNMHSTELFSASVCHAGCKCKEGYVLDTKSKRCVKPTECPCHHSGRSYKENSTVQSDCNTCKCQNGKWKCTDRQCTSECSAWGDSHYKTFDGKHYDYQGQCDYVLAKGALEKTDSFDITIQNVPCGSLGTACSKSVTVRVNSGGEQESLTLTKEKPLPQYDTLKHLTLRQKGLFVIVEAPDLNFALHWDKGTRVYIKIHPRWKGKIKGLCGNYNDDDSDDFQTPSGGIPEVSAKIFGDSWKLQAYCPEALEITNTCEDRPDRKVWALKKCGILKTPLFAPCHSEVPLDNYLEKCVFDSCACDQGGDCECLCTALAAYAQECNNRGVPIKWRTQELCPMQCDERCSKYSPCISTCPIETCDNILTQNLMSKSCSEDTCVEGCSPKPCPPNHVYVNSSLLDCVPRNVCKPFCLEIDGIAYNEGDLIEEDACHSCFCSRGQKSCTGQPCVTTASPSDVTHQLEQLVKCKSGWTKWINQDKIVIAKTKGGRNKLKKSDVEPLPTEIILNNLKESSTCSIEQMVDIECRTVKSHIPAKATGVDVECSLERGLICNSAVKGRWNCPDFEIRVKCQCEAPTTTTVASLLQAPCDINRPNEEHPTNCHLFYHCAPGLNGPEYIEKTCGPDMFYNPNAMICDWPDNVKQVRPFCEESDNLTAIPAKMKCPPGQIYDDCAIHCDRLCLLYSYAIKEEQGLCQDGAICSAGCVSADKQLGCPPGMFWADENTCVNMRDCMCRSYNGTQIKPGQVFDEKDCEKCQCIDNYYTCHQEFCGEDDVESHIVQNELAQLETEVEKKVDVATLPPVIIPFTVTPPKKCDENLYINLIQGDSPLPDTAFSASSILSPSFAPSHARLDSKMTQKSGGSWAPEFTNENQYLQIDLGRQEPIYGVIVRGSPLYDEYVTSYKVMYSPDNQTYYYVLNDENHPQIFRGSIDGTTPVKTIFEVPFEAQSVRINPQTWNNGISLRVELIGCGVEPTTTVTTPAYEYITVQPGTTTQKPKFCEDPMGIDDGMMADQQIATSSDLTPGTNKFQLKLNSLSAWQPLTNSPTEWVQFDFLEPRNITGLITKGGDKGWVSAFTVKYSQNKKDWNPMMDNNQKEKLFLGNFDKTTLQNTSFDLPINARYIRVIPLKWNENIQLKIEVLGCFKPYPSVEPVSTTTAAPPSPCNTCPGVTDIQSDQQGCKCKADMWWDGEDCVSRPDCPCMVGHISYAVGSVYEEEDCSQCVCKLGGVSHCTPKKCDKCPSGLKSIITSTCACTCKPCPDGTTLCPTSDICINSTLWCNGIQDCPDDELDCLTTTEEPPTTIIPTTTTIKPIKKCPEIQCHPGYRKKELKKMSKSKLYHSYLSPMISVNGKNTKSRYIGTKTTGGVKGGIKRPNLQRPQSIPIQQDEEICKEYKCVSTKPPPKFIHTKEECPPIVCQATYIPVFDFQSTKRSKECPRYSCYPPPFPDAVCNVTGRTFNTFDDIEFKYDICNHVLARDLQNDEWDISLKKNCTTSCLRDLIIRHQNHLFIMHPDLSVEFDGYRYSVDQTKKIGSQSRSFSISQLGNTLLFASNRYGFWVIWNTLGNIKLGVVHKLVDKVDGLCGYFNDNGEDDKRKPDGSQARTTVDFGDSWALASDQPLICEAKACPIHIQNKAWEMCNKVKDQTLSPCARVVDIEAFVSRCLETTCACLESNSGNHTGEEECRCQSMQAFVVDCLTADAAIDLSDWRMQQDCPASCDAPLVYHDCYQRKCEPTCESISDPNVCPKTPNVCFPGCYCPPGHVRKGDSCIKPSSCRDCECNVLPHMQYVTYDENNFTITGNCVYVMSRDVLMNNENQHKFQVLVTNAPCKSKPDKTCVGKITILYEGRKVHVFLDTIRNKLKMIVDGERIYDFSEVEDWANVRETATKHFKILLTNIQVEVSVYFPSLGVSVKAPSHKYGGKLEGLCGDCNGDSEDDLKTPSGGVPKDINEFGLSWLYEHLPGGQSKEMCENKLEEDCPPLAIDSDPCVQLVDMNKFGQCLNVLDPMLFVDWCRKDTCGDHPELACAAIEAYARDCANAGFCVNWRTDLCAAKSCPSDQIYDPCGTNCPKTCESIKEKTKKKCKEIPVEGCFCPEGKVLLNDTCVEVNDCEVCDDEGHHPGDKWKKDKCTSCRCDGTTLKCETQHCPGLDTVCERGYTALKLPSKDDECCDKYTCVPEPTAGPTCETPQKLVCGSGQILKLDTKPNGCQTFICECKPIEDCDDLNTTSAKPLEPGYIREIDDSGCCPEEKIICKKDLCPLPEDCPQYHTLKTDKIEGRCCPLYSCEPPKDKCIYLTEFISSDKGGERILTRYEKQNLLKNANETWKDGPCRECKCLLSSIGNYQPSCSKTECSSIHSHSDITEYELEEVPVYDQCCPKIKRIGCKYHNTIYKAGEKWTKESDYCVNFECVQDDVNGVQKETQVKTCDTSCDLGYEYVPATKECCGSCKQIACVVDGIVYQVGDKWMSSDFCTNYFCLNINGSMQVQSVLVNCPELPSDFIDNYVYKTEPIPGECCKKHSTTACKIGKTVYKINETWPSPDGDKCKTVTCVRKENGELMKQESIETCKTDCAKGWKYVESNTTCCGDCIQIACLIGDDLKYPGENWTSPDGCTTFICEHLGDQFVVSSQQESCPTIDDCPDENVYLKGCCKHCNITSSSQVLCSPETIELSKTVNLIETVRFPNGKCTNKDPIPNFTECVGSCHSSTFFNIKSGLHESECSCCQATKFETIEVELECEDGYKWMKKVAVPSKCGCEGCAANQQKQNLTKSPTKTFTKH